MKTILITGSAGKVARIIRPHLRKNYSLRLLDRVTTPEIAENETMIVGDICDQKAIQKACEGVDGVIHLACAYALDIAFENTIDANYRAILYLLDACKKFNIPRFIFASSHHVLGQHKQVNFVGDDAPAAPDGFYGLSKLFGEDACALYSYKYGIRTLSIRIGNADVTVSNDRTKRIWVSGRDLAQLIQIGLENNNVFSDIVYGVSASPNGFFQNKRAFELGYQPQDNSQYNLDNNFINYDKMTVDDGKDFVGGAYTPKDLFVNNIV